MQQCPKCGRQYPPTAVICPKCKIPFTNFQTQQQGNMQYQQPPIVIKRGLSWWQVLLIVIGAIIIIPAVIGAIANSDKDDKPVSGTTTEGSQKSTSSAPATKPKEKETIKISASDLLVAYDENGVKADEDYKGKLLEVTGIIRNIDKDFLDETYVTLDTGADFELISVQCYFKGDSAKKLSELKKGEEVTIIGTCDGSVVNVILEKCYIK